ncbi:amidoligase enzyme [Fusarium mundagurra]|uniref:Amidoligase enzyme n=1 Tax=Fusarium mundagurra TaxID=1567541 RepID=A0A8H5YUP7_9HYPO|nr:amidoligase enzyme [Fusarium mundagurra]
MDTISVSRKRRFSDSVVQCCRSPTSSKSASPSPSSPCPLPLRFGFELETMIRPKSSTGIDVPGDTSVAEQRRFGFRLLPTIARALNEGGFPSTVFDPNEDDKPDYSVWNVMLDGSLSKRHQRDGYYPVEIVSPVMDADMNGKWSELVDRLWRTLLQSFEFRLDSTCGFHIHLSFSQGDISMSQLRNLAKAVAF